MSATPPITAWMPKVSAEPKPDEVHRLLTLAFQKIGNHATAFGIQQAKINSLKAGATKTIVEGGSGGGGVVTPASPTGIQVNNQSGVASYATVSGDDGAMIVFSDASAIAVSLTNQSPPWSCFIVNQGSSTVTLTPAMGTISYAGNPASANMPIAGGGSALVAFDGTNWWAELSISSSGSTGVPSVDGITGPVTLVAGSNITITDNSPSAGDITIAATGGGSAYLKGTVVVAASGLSGTFRGAGTVTGAAAGMSVAASAPDLIGFCGGSPVYWVADVNSTNLVEVLVTLPNIGVTWSSLTFYVTVFP